jgi:hypothetical protein
MSEPGEQHHTRLDQATLIGGYIATGYITYDQAIAALEQAVVDSGAERKSSEFDGRFEMNHPTVAVILQDPDMAGMVEASKIHYHADRDLGNGHQMGNSRSMREALAKVEPKVKEVLERRNWNNLAKREALQLIQSAYMEGRANFIRNYGPIPG